MRKQRALSAVQVMGKQVQAWVTLPATGPADLCFQQWRDRRTRCAPLGHPPLLQPHLMMVRVPPLAAEVGGEQNGEALV